MLTCPDCHNVCNDTSATYCESCGAELVVTCPRCHQQVTPGVFCGKCGGNLAVSEASTKQLVTCSYCHKQVPAADFCLQCGQCLDGNALRGKPKHGVLAWIGILLLNVFATLVGSGLVVFIAENHRGTDTMYYFGGALTLFSMWMLAMAARWDRWEKNWRGGKALRWVLLCLVLVGLFFGTSVAMRESTRNCADRGYRIGVECGRSGHDDFCGCSFKLLH